MNLTEVSAPVDLHLYTTDGTRVAISRNAGIADEQISFNLEANVAYVIAVTPTSSAAQGFYDINGSFSVSSSAQSAAYSSYRRPRPSGVIGLIRPFQRAEFLYLSTCKLA